MKTEKNIKNHQDRDETYLSTAKEYYPLLFFFALLVLIGFLHQYSRAAYPFRAIFILPGILAVSIGLLAASVKKGVVSRNSGILVILYALFTGWVIVRNELSPLPSAGRPFTGMVLPGIWIIAAIILALSQESLSIFSTEKKRSNQKISQEDESVFNQLTLRHVLIVFFVILAVIFSINGIYQYYIGYEKQLRLVNQTGLYQGEDAISQGIRHALKEKRVSSGFGNPNIFGAFLSICFPFFLYLFIRIRRNYFRLLISAGILLIFFTLILTRSRGGLLTFFFSGICFLTLYNFNSLRKNRKRIIKYGLIVAGALAVIFLILMVTQGGAANKNQDTEGFYQRFLNISTIRERIYYFRTGWEMIKSNPLFGRGPGVYGLMYPRYITPGAGETKYAHNFIIQLWAELGIAGLILFLSFAGYGLYISLKKMRTNPAIAPLIAAAMAFLFNSMFEFTFYQGAPYYDFCIFLAAAVGGSHYSSDKKRKRYISGPDRYYYHVLIIVLASFPFISGYLYQPLMGGAQTQFGHDAKTSDQLEAALFHYQKALKRQPDNPWYHHNLARAYWETGNPEKAEAELKKALELNPFSASLHEELSRLYEAMYRPGRSLEMQREAVRKYPLKAEHHFRLARLLLKNENRREALKHAKKALELARYKYERRKYEEFIQSNFD